MKLSNLKKDQMGLNATNWSLNEMSWMLASTNITIVNIIANIIVDGLHPLLGHNGQSSSIINL
jgi:hypothetical protein